MIGTWREALESLSTRGVQLLDQEGKPAIFPVRIIQPERSGIVPDDEKFDYIIVLVKSWQTNQTVNRLIHLLAEDGRVLTLQNGLGNLEALAHKLGKWRVFAGVTTAGATVVAPGIVRPGGIKDQQGSAREKISVQHIPDLEPLIAKFRSAGFEVEYVADEQSLVWGKLVISSAINPLTALLEVTNGVLVENEYAKRVMLETALETAEVSKAMGIPLPFHNPGMAALTVAKETAANRSSMLQDILRGAPTEIDAINGALVKLGELHAIPTPLNQLFSNLIHAKVKLRSRAEA